MNILAQVYQPKPVGGLPGEGGATDLADLFTGLNLKLVAFVFMVGLALYIIGHVARNKIIGGIGAGAMACTIAGVVMIAGGPKILNWLYLRALGWF